jgi:hypothetical protein
MTYEDQEIANVADIDDGWDDEDTLVIERPRKPSTIGYAALASFIVFFVLSYILFSERIITSP